MEQPTGNGKGEGADQEPTDGGISGGDGKDGAQGLQASRTGAGREEDAHGPSQYGLNDEEDDGLAETVVAESEEGYG